MTLSTYDATTPGPPRDDALAARFAALRACRAAVDLDAIRDVALVVGSSRGGTSMLTEMLRRCPGVLSIPGELNPYVAVAQLSDAGAPTVRAELARAVGTPPPVAAAPDRHVLDTLAGELRWRLLAQWPALDVEPEVVERAVASAAGAPGSTGAAALRVLARSVPRLDLGAYDGGRPSSYRPREPVVEMTPFVLPRPWRLATEEQCRAGTLVIGTPRNSYRLAWLRTLFPAARIRVVHVTRNPAAAINGLVDGWRHWGFHCVRMPVPLAIGGYSQEAPGGDRWWKFDVPPGWAHLRDRHVAEVAAAQWATTHRAVLDDAGAGPALRVRYEDLVGPPRARAAAAGRLAAFLGIAAPPLQRLALDGIEPRMATAAPRPRRWAETGNDIAPGLADPLVWEVASELGYQTTEAAWI